MKTTIIWRRTAAGGLKWAVLAAAGVFVTLLPGCSTDSFVRLKSVEKGVMDAPALAHAAYAAGDPSTADIYLTDLEPADLDRGTDLAGVTGRIVHIHLFVVPLAGSTPIAPSACSVTVRHIILAKGSIGVYAGGGFLLPDGKPGDSEIGGSIRGATMRLTAANPAFADRLGAATLDATFSAPRDEGMARRIAARVNDCLAATRGVERGAGGTGAAGNGG